MRQILLLTQFILSIPGYLFLIFFADLRVYGLRNLKSLSRERGVIFASNHDSALDPILVPVSLLYCPRFLPLYFVSFEGKYYRHIPFGQYIFGFFLRFLGAFVTKKGLHDYSKSLAPHVEILRQGGSFGIFPEGLIVGRKPGARGGVSYMAEATGSAVVPVAILGINRLSLIKLLTFGYRITVVFGEPTKYSELYSEVITGIRKLDVLAAVHKEENSVSISAFEPILSISSGSFSIIFKIFSCSAFGTAFNFD